MVCNGICDGIIISCDGSIVFFSAGLPQCFYIIILRHFKCCCWLRSVFHNNNIYIYIYIYSLNTSLIMNVAYLKVFILLGFYLFFGAGLLMSFHGHICPSVMIICVQPQT